MNLHEYQAKQILSSFGIDIQKGYTATTPQEAVEAAKRLEKETGSKFFVIKAQIHAGGRGKGGGIKLAKSYEEVYEKASQILGKKLVTPQTGPAGKPVNIVFIAEDVYYPNQNGELDTKEYYISILLNRKTGKNVIIYSAEGGMEIEEVAAKSPEKIFKEEIDPLTGLMPYQARKIAFNLKATEETFKKITDFVLKLYKAYISTDANLIEINPLLKTSDNRIIAVDAKIKLDDDALFRHPDYKALRDKSQEDPAEVEASEYGLNFIKLDGDVGCMVNGAGLAMATMDIIKLSGANPANFLDVGGKATSDTVEAGFKIILKDPNVKAILINIFGGIVRCDRIAQGIVQAYQKIGNINVPVIVRLQGTNNEEGRQIIENSGLKVRAATTLEEAANLVKEALQ